MTHPNLTGPGKACKVESRIQKSNDSERLTQGIFNHITSKWGTLTLITLKNSDLRFSQIKKIQSITDRMLIKTLHELETDGLVCKKVTGDEKRRVVYSLSPAGYELTLMLEELTDWIHDFVSSSEKIA